MTMTEKDFEARGWPKCSVAFGRPSDPVKMNSVIQMNADPVDQRVAAEFGSQEEPVNSVLADMQRRVDEFEGKTEDTNNPLLADMKRRAETPAEQTESSIDAEA